MWIRWRTTWAHGPGVWQFMEIPDEFKRASKKKVEAHLDEIELGRKNEWSDKYRGYEWERIKQVPHEEIERRLNRHRELAAYHASEAARFEAMLALEEDAK
jgi:ribonuclease D